MDIKRQSYKSLMRNGRTSAIQPCLLVGMSRGHERRGGNLFCIQPETHFARVVLALWNGAGDRLRGESVVLHQRVELLDAVEVGHTSCQNRLGTRI